MSSIPAITRSPNSPLSQSPPAQSCNHNPTQSQQSTLSVLPHSQLHSLSSQCSQAVLTVNPDRLSRQSPNSQHLSTQSQQSTVTVSVHRQCPQNLHTVNWHSQCSLTVFTVSQLTLDCLVWLAMAPHSLCWSDIWVPSTDFPVCFACCL